jgi:hypothetical protein
VIRQEETNIIKVVMNVEGKIGGQKKEMIGYN